MQMPARRIGGGQYRLTAQDEAECRAALTAYPVPRLPLAGDRERTRRGLVI
jgi:hypothetical protein